MPYENVAAFPDGAVHGRGGARRPFIDSGKRQGSSARVCLTGLALASAFLAAPAFAAEETVPYVVKPGDTLIGLARQYLVNPEDYRTIQQLNRVVAPRRMAIGRRLQIPVRLLRTTPVVARLGAYRGPVEITDGGQPGALRVGRGIGDGVVISTGANGFARIDFPDGSRIAVPSQSRVRIDYLRQTILTQTIERGFLVEKGRSESSVTPLKSPQDKYIVRTPISVSAVRGTEFNVRYDPDRALAATEVLTGAVAVDADGQSSTIAASFGVVVTGNGLLAAVPLPPKPTLLRANDLQDQAAMRFELEPVAGAVAYRVRLAADAGFLDKLAEETSSRPEVVFENIANGTYFVRMSVIDDKGLEGLPATYAVDRFVNTLRILPAVISNTDRQRRYLFRWEAGGEGRKVFRFQLFRDDGSTPVIDEDSMSQQQITVTDLPPGAYTWRLMSRTFVDGRRIDKWSTPEQFKIER